jgi:DNA-binding response OmpR family regulator
MPKRIQTLLVSADQEQSSVLSACLQRKGFAPLLVAETGAHAIDLFYEVAPHLVLLDLSLADCNSIDLCSEMLHTQPGVKIILVADDAEQLALVALHVGVAGCIDRNFPLAEWPGVLAYVLNGGVVFSRGTIEVLLAQTRAMQKREPMISIGPLRIDLARRLVLYAGRHVQLTPREFTLLVCLARRMDHVVTTDQLLNEAWGYNAEDGTSAQVRLYITRLRRKLTDDAHTPDFILNERGVGYRLHSGVLRSAGPCVEPRSLNGKALHPLHILTWLPWPIIQQQRASKTLTAPPPTGVAEQSKAHSAQLTGHDPLHGLEEQSGALLEHSPWVESFCHHFAELLHPAHEVCLPLLAEFLSRLLPAL